MKLAFFCITFVNSVADDPPTQFRASEALGNSLFLNAWDFLGEKQ